ncbi:MAG: amidohydrolase family protein [Chitinophagales bacterium]|nr:amidohydrolase family protein [Chitinophagales bacterium]MDW8418872.1 amidohydrolase family protein [Chitinophagales bacterium]
MRYCFFISLTCLLRTSVAQESTFKTNGPDDYREGKHLFANATIFTSYNFKIQQACLFVQNGKVVKAEPCNTPVTELQKIYKDWLVHDMTGRYIYPAFIDLFADYGIAEARREQKEGGPQPESNIKGAYGWNQAIHTDFHADRHFTANEKQAEEWRKLGFGAVLTHRKDGIARGTGALVTLQTTDKENFLCIKADAAAFFSFQKGTSTQDYPSSLMGAIALLRQTHYDAQWYKQVRNSPPASANLTPITEYNINLEEWNRQLNLPQIFDAAGDWQHILRADKIGDEFNIRYIIKGNGNEYQRADAIKQAQVRLIIPLNFPKPYDVEDPNKAAWISLQDLKHWELAPTNPAMLAKAGVEFAITTADLEKKEEFLPALRKAVKFGLDSVLALKALTYNPAVFINAYDLIGSLESGKLANFIITSKPLFDDKCEINEVWIQGRRHEVKPFEARDIRGEYLLTWQTPEPNSHRLIVSGELSNLKAHILQKDTQKIEVKFTYREQDVQLIFTPDRNTKHVIRLSGVVRHNEKKWSGTGELPDGRRFTWSAEHVKNILPDSVTTVKDTTQHTKDLGKIIYPFLAYGNDTLPAPGSYIIKNGTVWTNEPSGILRNTDIIIRNGKIAEIGKNLQCAGCKSVDATGKHVTSGIIDEHSHIAISQGVNEGTEASSAEVRIGDVINAQDINIYRQLAGGVVAAQLLHGSANPIGGQSAIIKFRWGYLPEQMKIEGADGFIKFALGENVKQSNWGDKHTIRYPQTRMGVEQVYYNYFTKAREYEAAWKSYGSYLSSKSKSNPAIVPPRKDLELDALLEILQRKRFITCHSYVQSEINMLMHVADSFGFKVNTFTHILEGYKVADKMKAHGVNASSFSDWWAYKYEVIDAIPYNTALLMKMGICTAVNSDDAEMARRLNQEAAKAVKYGGLSEEDAWKTVTLNPAKMLHLDHRTGSIKKGKDADVVVWSDNPLSVYAKAEQTFVDGILFFDIRRDEEKRSEILAERARLIQKMLLEKKSGSPTQEPVRKTQQMYNCSDGEHVH